MFAYTTVLSATCLLALLASQVAASAQRQIALLLIMILTTFAAARGYVGTDTGAYHAMFDEHAGDPIDEVVGVVEPAFALLLKLTSYVSTSSFLFVMAISLVQGILLLRVVARSANPALFLALYASTFYLNFQFNVLRSGVAALFLLLAIDYLRTGAQPKFYAAGVMSLVCHYSSFLFFLPMTVMRRSFAAGIALFTVTGVIAFALLGTLLSDARLLQYLSYLAFADAGAGVDYGMGLVVLFALYAVIVACTLSRSNALLLGSLLVAWCALRILSNQLLFVDRFEVVVNIVLIYLLLSYKPTGMARSIRTTAIVCLVALNCYGTLAGLPRADQDAQAGFNAEPTRQNSSYLPYRFVWEE